MTTLLVRHTTTGMQLTKIGIENQLKNMSFLVYTTAVLSQAHHARSIEKHSLHLTCVYFLHKLYMCVCVCMEFPWAHVYECMSFVANVIKGIEHQVCVCSYILQRFGSTRFCPHWMCAFLFVFLLTTCWYVYMRDNIVAEER